MFFFGLCFQNQQELAADPVSAAGALKTINCCPRCVLRFLGERDISLYKNAEEVREKNVSLSIISFVAFGANLDLFIYLVIYFFAYNL